MSSFWWDGFEKIYFAYAIMQVSNLVKAKWTFSILFDIQILTCHGHFHKNNHKFGSAMSYPRSV